MTEPSVRARQIPLARPDIGERELELVVEVLRSDVLGLGPFGPRFSSRLSDEDVEYAANALIELATA
jgi:dTDP-4-amino-4,6-dideoxygalactose transaminase